MGKASNWQSEVEQALADTHTIICNPRRDNWDPSWSQSIDNPQFRAQVEWELDAMGVCDTIIMYFDPDTKSPISLLELGLHAESERLIVCCPEPFYRKGNVDIVCNYYGIIQVETLDDLIRYILGSVPDEN